MKKIVIIDGQGGRLGKLLVEETRARMPQAHILVIGTNGVATSTMQKAGADQAGHRREPGGAGSTGCGCSAGPHGYCRI